MFLCELAYLNNKMDKQKKILENKLNKLGVSAGDFGDLADAYGLFCYPDSVLKALRNQYKKGYKAGLKLKEALNYPKA